MCSNYLQIIMNITYDHDHDDDDEGTLKFELLNLWIPVILSQKRKIPDSLIMLLVNFNGSMIIIIISSAAKIQLASRRKKTK